MTLYTLRVPVGQVLSVSLTDSVSRSATVSVVTTWAIIKVNVKS